MPMGTSLMRLLFLTRAAVCPKFCGISSRHHLALMTFLSISKLTGEGSGCVEIRYEWGEARGTLHYKVYGVCQSIQW